VYCFPTSAAVAGEVLFVGGECIDGDAPDRATRPSAESYYANKRIGVRLSLTSGEVKRGLVPFETSCEGAGACVGGSIAALDKKWIATLPVSHQIGIYSSNGDLLQTFGVGSAAATTRDGSHLPDSASSQERVNWSARNSLIHGAFIVGNRVVIAHYFLELPKDGMIGAPPQFKTRINVLTDAGVPLDVDIAMPELPVGSDNEAVYVVDYGSKGRQGAYEAVNVLRISLPPVS